MSNNIDKQTKAAFDFIQKFYFEISYLIKEIEGTLQREKEEFLIGRPSGYGVTSRTSTGLELVNVENWLPKVFTVFFSPKMQTTIARGKTVTKFSDNLKLLIVDIKVFGKNIESPIITFGHIYGIQNKKEKQTKFEQLMWEFTYNRDKVFSKMPNIVYDDSYVAFKGEFLQTPLFSVNTSEEVVEKIVKPLLVQYRK